MGMDNVFGEPTFEQPRKRKEPFNAAAARNMSAAASSIIAEKELRPVFELIEKAAKTGEYFVHYDVGTLSKHSILRLEKLGFAVDNAKKRIDWGEVQEEKKPTYSYKPYETSDIYNQKIGPTDVPFMFSDRAMDFD